MTQHNRLRGRDLHAPSNELVSNLTGALLPAFKVVSLDGMGPVYPKVKLANPATFFNFGITSDEIKNGQAGLVTTQGFMFEVDTSAFLVDALLYSTNTGDLTDTPNGTAIARVIKSDPDFGVLYVLVGGESGGSAPAWDIDGNTGILDGNFLGTRDMAALRLRTNNLQRAIITADGRVGFGVDAPGMYHEVKAHTSLNATGLQTETFYLETSALGYSTAFVLALADPSVNQVTFSATAVEPDSSNIASFKRTGLFYRQASNAQVVDAWTSDFTQKTANLMNVQYVFSGGSIIFRVRPATAELTRWTGYLQVQRLS